MANVTKYSVLFYSGANGYSNNRAQIQLSDGNTVVAWLRFKDPGMTFENDALEGGIIRMHLPISMFAIVLDVLRNEKPITIYFTAGKGFLSTSNEPIGEGETTV
jgi:hypothetical protein